MFDLLSSSPQLPFGAWMPCSSIVCTWSITSVHSSHRMQLPPGNATLEWWRAHLHETTRVQSPDKGAVAMARAQAFPMSAHEPLLLCLAAEEGAWGPSVRGSGLWLVEQLSCGSPYPYSAGEAGRDSHLLWVTGGCAVLGYCQDGSWLLTKSHSGLVVQSPMCCADVSQERITSLRGAFLGTCESLSTTT